MNFFIGDCGVGRDSWF